MKLKKEILQIKGMHCDGCASAVSTRLEELEGITESVVDLSTDSAQVQFHPGTVTKEDFARAIEKAGYTLVGYGKENQEK